MTKSLDVFPRLKSHVSSNTCITPTLFYFSTTSRVVYHTGLPGNMQSSAAHARRKPQPS